MLGTGRSPRLRLSVSRGHTCHTRMQCRGGDQLGEGVCGKLLTSTTWLIEGDEPGCEREETIWRFLKYS
jgi:hypothetical protein